VTNRFQVAYLQEGIKSMHIIIVSHNDIRIKQEDAHSWFHHFLRSISLDENAYEILVEIIKNEFDKINKQNKVGPKQREKLKNLEEKLIKVQDLFIDRDLTKEEYQNHKKTSKI
jgi:hypothetical protein